MFGQGQGQGGGGVDESGLTERRRAPIFGGASGPSGGSVFGQMGQTKPGGGQAAGGGAPAFGQMGQSKPTGPAKTIQFGQFSSGGGQTTNTAAPQQQPQQQAAQPQQQQQAPAPAGSKLNARLIPDFFKRNNLQFPPDFEVKSMEQLVAYLEKS